MRIEKSLYSHIAVVSVLLSGAVIASPSAWAYFPGKVEIDNAELKQQPRPDAPTIKSLPKGTAFNATDKPNNGYYYIRTATDLGWIDGVSIGKPPENHASEQAPAPTPAPTPTPTPSPTTAAAPQKKSQPQQRKRTTRKRTKPASSFMVKAHGDYNIFSVSDLNTATHSSSFGNAIGLGGEFMWFFNPITAVGLRLDSISQKVSATDSSTSSTYDFSLSTFAIMVGGERILWEDADYYVAADGYLGIASSKLTVNKTTSSATDSFEYSGKPITFLVLLEGGWKLNSTFSLYGEAGYRLLNSSNAAVTGSSSVSGTILPSTVSLNFSGPLIGLGVSARF